MIISVLLKKHQLKLYLKQHSNNVCVTPIISAKVLVVSFVAEVKQPAMW